MHFCEGEFDVVARTLHGLEGICAKEIRDLGIENTREVTRAVRFKSDLRTLYKANLRTRTAINFLVEMHDFEAGNDREFYKGIQEINWSEIFTANQTFKIDVVSNGEFIRHARYAAQKAKDAIVDQLRDETGERPAISTKEPQLKIFIHVSPVQDASYDSIRVSLDSSGKPLNMRGYSANTTFDAPLNECLAAGLLIRANYKGEMPFFDPMCGSGTLLIEAAMIAKNMAPGLNREFSFQHWPNYNAAIFEEEKDIAKEEIIECPVKISGSDAASSSIQAAIQKVTDAGLEDEIHLRRVSIENADPKEDKGFIVVNPPYGERLTATFNPKAFYKKVGKLLIEKFAGYETWVFSGNRQAVAGMTVKSGRKYEFLNGPLQCTFKQFKPWLGEVVIEDDYAEKSIGGRDDRRGFGGDRRDDRRSDNRGERRGFGGDRRERGDDRNFEDRRQDDRGERKSFGGDRRDDRRSDSRGERRGFGGDRRERGGDRNFEDRRSDNRGERRGFGGDRREGGSDRSFGDRRSDNRGERRSFGGERRDDRREFRDDNGERRTYDASRPNRKSSQRDNGYGERKSFSRSAKQNDKIKEDKERVLRPRKKKD